jgi:hypothetical protein
LRTIHIRDGQRVRVKMTRVDNKRGGYRHKGEEIICCCDCPAAHRFVFSYKDGELSWYAYRLGEK